MMSETNRQQRLLLTGCGAVGGVIAGGLRRAGHDLSIVTHNDEITRAIQIGGVRVSTPDDHWTVPARACSGLGEVSGPFDAILMTMKATGVEQAARDVLPYLAPGGYVVTLQNGVVEDRVAAIVGRDRVVGALVGWGATMHAPGVYEMTSRGETIIGELDGRPTERVQQLRDILAAAAPVTVSPNIYGVLWSKLGINCVISPLGAVTGQLLGDVLRRARVRRLGMAVVSEVIDVARAHGVRLEPVGGTLDLDRLYLPAARRRAGLAPGLLPRHAIMLMVQFKFRRLKSSMLQSLERQRPTEIDFLNSYVVEKGRQKQVPTPVNEALTRMVREIETGVRPIRPANLDELLL